MSQDFAEIQHRFARDIFADTQPGISIADVRAGRLSSSERLDIYRYNVNTVLSNALRDLYPVLVNVVGEDFFREAARQFVRATPSTSGDLNEFGADFASFLRDYAHAKELPYLPDLARLERAWHRAFHAADEAPMDFAGLASVAVEVAGEVVLGLHPSVALLRSDYPLFQIWEVNQPGYLGDWQVDWDAAESCVVVYRQEYAVAAQALNAPQYIMLAAIAEGRSLAEVLSVATDKNSSFDVQGFLAHCVQLHIINKFRTPS